MSVSDSARNRRVYACLWATAAGGETGGTRERLRPHASIVRACWATARSATRAASAAASAAFSKRVAHSRRRRLERAPLRRPRVPLLRELLGDDRGQRRGVPPQSCLAPVLRLARARLRGDGVRRERLFLRLKRGGGDGVARLLGVFSFRQCRLRALARAHGVFLLAQRAVERGAERRRRFQRRRVARKRNRRGIDELHLRRRPGRRGARRPSGVRSGSNLRRARRRRRSRRDVPEILEIQVVVQHERREALRGDVRGVLRVRRRREAGLFFRFRRCRR